MKKAFHSIFSIILAGMVVTGCTDEVQFGNSFLDKAPGGTTTLDSIFANEVYVNQLLTNIYNKQYYGLPYGQGGPHSQNSYTGKLDALTDIYQIHWSSQEVWTSYYNGTLSAKENPLISYTADYFWETVHMVSIIKENIDRVPNMDERKKKYIVAQAKALQAFAYAVRLPIYGGLPIIEKTINNDDVQNGGMGKRASFDETVKFICRLCDEAAPDLYWAYNGNDSESNSLQTGRWTKAGVMALKAQTLWIAASPLFNGPAYYPGVTDEQRELIGYGSYDAGRWQTAKAAFDDFWRENAANGEYYHLYTDVLKKNCDGYRLAYRRGYMYDDSPENIHFTKIVDYEATGSGYNWGKWNWDENGVRRLRHDPTLEYVEMFPWSDGKPFIHDESFKLDESKTYKDADGVEWKVYTCLDGKGGSNDNDKLFYTYKAVRGGFTKSASRAPRLYENAIVTGTKDLLTLQSATGESSGNVIETWVGGQNGGNCVKDPVTNVLTENQISYCPTGFGPYKYVLFKDEWFRDPNNHWNVLTIPDMILMYAECLAECGDLPGAVEQVDKIRSRVGMKGIVSCNTSLDLKNNKDNLIEEILRERACELGMTNARYIDMIRRKRTDWMTKQLHGMATYRMIKNSQNQWVRRNAPWFGDDKNGGMAEPSRFEYEFFELNTGRRVLWNYSDDQNNPFVLKWFLMPFPQDEVNKGYGLIQTPGW
ncbi:MAG: RagB/SusD family nutrient uptake outer membrane protein [Muribaculaceae bacterium]|nr:RagB/SusD family nutrient uptake outer membrane protein [Muribaculaceae bacterium]